MKQENYECNFRFILSLMFIAFIIAESSSENYKGLPQEVDGWKRSQDVLVYSPENLYEYINGAAELYLSYDFDQLRVGEYSDHNNASIIVDIYRHLTPLYAFGIYSQEKPLEGNFMEIGAQGYRQELMLNFIKGVYYVKISGSDFAENSEQIIQEFALKIAHDLDGTNLLPQALSLFPDKDKIKNSERFVAQNFLGYHFMNKVYTAEYRAKDIQFTMFIFKGSGREDCKEMLMEYIKQTNMDVKDISEGTYTISDPYYGMVSLFWNSKFIAGIMELFDDDLKQEYLRLLEEKIIRIGEIKSD